MSLIIENELKMKTINIKWMLIGIISTLLLNLKAQEKTDKELIIGTWVSQEDFTSYWIFEKDGTAISYYHNDIDGTFSYSIIKENQSHVLLLKLINIKNNQEIYDYYIDSLGEDVLQITPIGNSLQNTEFYNRKRQQEIKEPKESPSSKTLLKEEESEPSFKWQLKLSDRDRGYFEGGLAYEQCKKEQDKDVFDRDRQMPIERMEWGSKAPRLGLGDCREKAFERIKMRTEEYQTGFKEGWRDDSMPVNNKKDITKKK